MLTFGPVPSRRLGRSLGINNIPPKICTYSCVYCQLGKTFKMKIEPTEFYQPKEILSEVQNKVEKAKKMQESIDYLTFVPDGEPTLDINLGQEIKLIKSLGIKIAVITNSSLIDQKQVRENLMEADLISFKIDSVEEKIWRKVDRPHKNLSLKNILNSILKFRENFKGEIITETMLVKDINDNSQHIKEVAKFLAKLKPSRSYLSLPIRPPADSWVQSPSEEVVNQSYNLFKEKINQVEFLIGYEGNAFAFTGEVEEDILSITSVHPMREDALKDFLGRANSDWSTILKLINKGQLVETDYKGNKFYIRKFKK
ncbi:MAG: radical SAM protein [Candidatus Infernicultor aquiphilus]|uniref:Radical SAM protein n=2 Tax=Candidatus Infernicultor aquiphilus TaxID=1805029 RepID=A0A1J5G908_9BACT|nr:MAG: radical SAM protein [Candidatus Atribacteria bacterium CG2_30_33_13]PIW11970.1 MAG: radical SAM protein [Candidatus Atribacteria bacterium CG17_big_fil_post_rev_8_21_14_2_50_34_11]PIY32142.1 MAG: radical SAM protein [Candidatus Atribacteria bacterium CG_4_10_14_3_um_filter_34_13]PJB57812.1 MAG: radical SAM protein [Candidatus Atribacteria bacterium CG_4_9_14_3_um_filter_33_16]